MFRLCKKVGDNVLITSNKSIEWESLQEPIIIEKIIPSDYIPPNSEKIIVNRTDSYQITATLTSVQENVPFEKNVEYAKRFYVRSPGSLIKPFNIEGEDQNGSKVELRNCFVTNMSSHVERDSYKKLVTLNILVDEIIIEKNNDSEVSFLSEWYLNGPNGVLFPRYTLRLSEKESNKVSIGRVTVDITEPESIELSVNSYENSQVSTSSRDFALVTLDDIKFILAIVPNNYGPNWSKNICIEYRKEFGSIPDDEKREAISEIVGFVLGVQLLNVGFTEYNHDGQMLVSLARSSWGRAYSRFICENTQTPPFSLTVRDLINGEEKIEELLCSLVPKYLDLRDKLNLKEALWRYWISRNMPIGTNLPVLSSALEIIMTSWFESENSKSRAFYMEQKEFNKLIEEGLKNIEEKLDEYIENKIKSLESETKESLEVQEIKGLKNTIVGKIRNSNQMSVTKKYLAFFKEIGLVTGSIEGRAITTRHSMAHGDKVDREEFEKMRRCTYAYQTLFHRVLLKVLGYEGNYVDRSVIGFPEKHIDLPLGKNK